MNLLLDALAWLGDPAQWRGAGSIPVRLAEHLAITAVAVVVAALLALPVGVAVGHTRRGQIAVVALAGAARAVPTLGLLVVGVWTTMAVEHTVRDAADLGYQVAIVSDATSSVNDDWQRAALGYALTNIATVTDTAEVAPALKLAAR